jgi:hypothetical protein
MLPLLQSNTNAINLYTPHPSLPLKGGGMGGGEVILFNTFALINLRHL